MARLPISNLSMLVLTVGIATLHACGDDPEVHVDAGPGGAVDGGAVDGGLVDARPDAGPDDPLAGLTCEPIAACGGELVGRWTFTTVCFDPGELQAQEHDPGQPRVAGGHAGQHGVGVGGQSTRINVSPGRHLASGRVLS